MPEENTDPFQRVGGEWLDFNFLDVKISDKSYPLRCGRAPVSFAMQRKCVSPRAKEYLLAGEPLRLHARPPGAGLGIIRRYDMFASTSNKVTLPG
ncbi:hypothetical protein ACHMW6_10760 [Pseudoduganella sp. UC29_106]|uniref:hypothetical protein n=1 Tax=Pseudoduganella sp. UC29_106 TaxID=3374553 RepID=UPI003756BD32